MEDAEEVVGDVKFLHSLGSVQYGPAVCPLLLLLHSRWRLTSIDVHPYHCLIIFDFISHHAELAFYPLSAPDCCKGVI